MVRRALLIGLALALAGCAAQAPETVVRTVTVKVPVMHQVYCDVPAHRKPALPIAGLSQGASPGRTVRAYAATVAILKGAVEQRDTWLDACEKPR